MPARLARGVVSSKHGLVCLSCHLQELSLAEFQTRRYQHSGPPANRGNINQESIPKDLEKYNESGSRSRIGDIIRSFIFKPNGRDKEIESDSKAESLGKNEQSRSVPENVPLTAPKPKDSTDVAQWELHQKFAAQRRKDILAMHASQASRVVERIENVPQAPSVPKSAKQTPKKSSIRAERKRKSREVAHDKRAKKRSKKMAAKPIEAAQHDIAEISTSKEPRRAADSRKSKDSSAEGTHETPGGGGSGSNNRGSGSTDNFPGKETATEQKLDDTMDILDSSKSTRKPDQIIEVAHRMEDSSTSTKIQDAVVATLNDFKNRGTPLTVNTRRADVMISHYSSQLMARLKANSVELRNLLEKALSDVEPHARTFTKSSFLSPSARSRLGRDTRVQTARKHQVHNPLTVIPGHKSLRDALGQKSAKVQCADLEPQQFVPNEKTENAKAPSQSQLEKVTKARAKSSVAKASKSKGSPKSPVATTTATELEIMPVMVEQPPVPRLAYGLERVLFNPGVYQLQDPRSRVYNFDPYLQRIMPIEEFDFNALKEYITSSRDESLSRIAKEHGKRYMGSTSSMTEVLAQFHFLLSQWRPINPSMLSKAFPVSLTSFTEFQRIPSAIFLRWKDGSYAIDADKQFETANVLSMLGKSMEKFLTLSTDDFERYRKSNPGRVTEDERFAPESYHYSTLGDFLMRSQLDAHDPRLPGTGMFDLKTRSVVSIRMDVANYEHGVGYEIKDRQGEWESYEREYYDMIRAAFLKYSLQVRMGRMDGIFVAFHNIERIFGFQYISLPEMDSTLHGQWDTSIGDQEFRLSLDLMNKVLDRATKKYPETSLRIFFETREAQTPFMYIFAEPVTEEQVAEIQSQNSAKIREFERKILGLTRGDDFENDDAGDIDPKWEEIQADVQNAMEKDELSADGPGQDLEPIDEDAAGTDSALSRPEVFEQGPLYARKNSAGADDDASLLTEEPNGDDKPGATSRQEDIDEARKPTNDETSTRYSPDAERVGIAEKEGQREDQIQADGPFLDSVNQEVVREDTNVKSSPPQDILAMTLTVRNKVNGEYVLRPEKMTPADEWSIEYSLTDVPEPIRARALYQACQRRRSKKMETSLVREDADVISNYIRKLREMSLQGRRWRKRQDSRDKKRVVEVL